MFWNKTLLKWKEPRYARTFIAKNLKFRDYFSAISKNSAKIFIGSYIVFWFLGWLSPRRDANPILSFDLAAISLILVLSYLLIWLMIFAATKLAKPEVYLKEKNIVYMSVEGSINIPYKKIRSFNIIKTKLEETEYSILEILDWDGLEGSFEIDTKISDESIIEIFKSKNIQMKKSLIYHS